MNLLCKLFDRCLSSTAISVYPEEGCQFLHLIDTDCIQEADILIFTAQFHFQLAPLGDGAATARTSVAAWTAARASRWRARARARRAGAATRASVRARRPASATTARRSASARTTPRATPPAAPVPARPASLGHC